MQFFFLQAEAGGSTDKKKKSKDRERRRSIIQLVQGLFHRSNAADKEKDKTSGVASPSSPPPLAKSPSAVVASPAALSDAANKAASPPLRSPKLKERASPFRLKNKEKQKEKKKKKSSGPSPVVISSPASPKLDESLKNLSISDEKVLTTPQGAAADVDEDDDPLALLSGGSGTLTRRQEKIAKRLSRQAELKRLRMAQEIQRQLEELEVKQRELEERGVAVEKALRGEGSGTPILY